MEKPYQGHATIHDSFTEVQIIVPARKNWFVIIFLSAWLCGWFIGEIFVLNAIIAGSAGSSGGIFLLVWLVAWTVGGFLAIKSWLWIIKGKEIITVGQGQLSIDRKGALFFKPRVYDLNEVKNIRIQDDRPAFSGFAEKRSDNSMFNSTGIIRFDYGLRTIKFANGIDEAEAKYILDKLKERRFIMEKNYN
jgi:hypothetical protein